MKRGIFLLLAIIAAAAIGLGGRYYFVGDKNSKLAETRIGGSFNLVDHKGRNVTEKDFQGQYLLMIFGYTYCPDVCPTGLTVISEVLDSLGKEGEKITPIFVSVDPERDTVEQLGNYVTNFHPRLVGLTGSLAQTSAAAKAWRVYYTKVPQGDTYSMDHSAIYYFMGPDGKFITHFGHSTKAPEMAEAIRKLLK